MRLIDSSAWIEWLIASPTALVLEPLLPARDDWLVPTIVQLELAKWLTREVGEDKADQVVAFSQVCVVASLKRLKTAARWRMSGASPRCAVAR